MMSTERKGNINGDGDYNKRFDTIYEDYFDDLFSYALVITDSESLAKDAVSDVFFDLLNSKYDLDAIQNIKAYLLTSVKNRCIRYLSKGLKDFDRYNSDFENQLVEKVNPQDLLIGAELEEFLNDKVASLPRQCQMVFCLIRNQNKKYREVALELNISVNTVRNHLVKAIKHIRSELEAYF